MNTKTIKQAVTFRASAHDVYEALMDAKKYAAFSGGPAAISRKVGGKFSEMDGSITGTNIELVQDERIVQSWRLDDWPEGHYSRATFVFKEVGGKTRMTFTQTGVPENVYEDVKQGWYDYYWDPMKEMLEK